MSKTMPIWQRARQVGLIGGGRVRAHLKSQRWHVAVRDGVAVRSEHVGVGAARKQLAGRQRHAAIDVNERAQSKGGAERTERRNGRTARRAPDHVCQAARCCAATSNESERQLQIGERMARRRRTCERSHGVGHLFDVQSSHYKRARPDSCRRVESTALAPNAPEGRVALSTTSGRRGGALIDRMSHKNRRGAHRSIARTRPAAPNRRRRSARGRERGSHRGGGQIAIRSRSRASQQRRLNSAETLIERRRERHARRKRRRRQRDESATRNVGSGAGRREQQCAQLCVELAVQFGLCRCFCAGRANAVGRRRRFGAQ